MSKKTKKTKNKKKSAPVVIPQKMEPALKLSEVIRAKREILRLAGIELKKHFVGIDNVIDKVLKDIEAWYCTPHILSRPMIVCLWGLTGTGKTDLVRKLVQFLDLADSFVEIQMCNKGGTSSFSKSLESVLEQSNISANEPGVLLLDEIQRFRSVDQDGKDIHEYSFQDLWLLLSDGNFGGTSDNKRKIMEMIMKISFDDSIRNKQFKKETFEEEKEERKYFFNVYHDACELKKLLAREESIEELMKWSRSKRLDALKEGIERKSAYKPQIFSKLLVFICGNLDEAYKMAEDVGSDVSADIFHENSLKIDLIRIKKALTVRFKPEQIARFGNAHVIYPALSEASYREIIRRKTADLLARTSKTANMEITVDQSVLDAIYRNGVFPTQGTRPVFSTISTMLETSLPQFILAAAEAEEKKFHVRYEDTYLASEIGGKLIKFENEGDIDKIKKDFCVDELYFKCVHEAGHALVHTIATGRLPRYINANSSNRGGVVINGYVFETKAELENEMMVGWSGRCAEEIFFGHLHATTGAVSDIKVITSRAVEYIRNHSFTDEFLGSYCEPYGEDADHSITMASETNNAIRKLVTDTRERAKKILADNKHVIIDIVNEMAANRGVLLLKDYALIMKKHNISFVEGNNPVSIPYAKVFKETK